MPAMLPVGSPRRVRRGIALIAAVVSIVLSSFPAGGQGTPGATPVAESDAPWWQGAPCYELFVRSFSDSDGDGVGDFQGVVDRLDYLNDGDPGGGSDLGITCIWLMPIMESTSYHGYDVTDYYAVESDYGTKDDFLAMMDAAHERGIRVIVDLVINHTGIDHPWFAGALSDPASPYRDWYIFEQDDPGFGSPWGTTVWHPTPDGREVYYGLFWSGMPDLDFRNPDVTAEIHRITGFWLTEMRVDGFRLDAVKHLIEDEGVLENTPETVDWLREYAALIRSIKPDAYTVGEVAGIDTVGLQPYYPDLLDQYFQFGLAGSIVEAVQFNSPATLSLTVEEATASIPDARFATFLTNHDQTRIATLVVGDGRDLRTAAILLLTLPGTPFIYYGEELGLPGDKPDEFIRTPLPWSAAANGGFTSGTPWQALQPGWETQNVATQTNDPASLLSTYRTWISLRHDHPALATGGYVPILTDDPGIYAFERVLDDERLVVVVNLDGKDSPASMLTLGDGASGSLVPIAGGSEPLTIASGAVTVGPIAAGDARLYRVEGDR